MPNYFDKSNALVHGYRHDFWFNGPSQNIQVVVGNRNMVNLMNPQTIWSKGYASSSMVDLGVPVDGGRNRSYGIPFKLDDEDASDAVFGIAYEIDVQARMQTPGDYLTLQACGLQGGAALGSATSGETQAWRNLPPSAITGIGDEQIVRLTAKGIFAMRPDPLKDGTPIWVGFAIINRESDPIQCDLVASVSGQICGTGENIYDPSL